MLHESDLPTITPTLPFSSPAGPAVTVSHWLARIATGRWRAVKSSEESNDEKEGEWCGVVVGAGTTTSR